MAPRKPVVVALSRLDELELLRADLRRAISSAQTVSPGAVAGLSKELRAVVAEIEAVKSVKAEEVSAVDDLAKRRADRRSAPADPAPAAKRAQPRRRHGGNRTG